MVHVRNYTSSLTKNANGLQLIWENRVRNQYIYITVGLGARASLLHLAASNSQGGRKNNIKHFKFNLVDLSIKVYNTKKSCK